jgi:hypothetical protein
VINKRALTLYSSAPGPLQLAPRRSKGNQTNRGSPKTYGAFSLKFGIASGLVVDETGHRRFPVISNLWTAEYRRLRDDRDTRGNGHEDPGDRHNSRCNKKPWIGRASAK